MSTPARWHLPADTEPQERAWIAFPRGHRSPGTTAWALSAVRRAWARVVHAVSEIQPVGLLVDPTDQHMVHTYVDPIIPVVPQRFDCPALRLTGPVFTLGAQDESRGLAQRPLGALDFSFNGFGRRYGRDHRSDAVLGGTLAHLAGAERRLSVLTLEGGAFVSDGEGTVIISEALALDPARNPGWTREYVERELCRGTDIERVIWLPTGLSRPSGPHGIGPQADQLVAFAEPSVILLHWQDDPSHPDHEVSLAALEALQGQEDARGRPLNIATVPAPRTLEDRGGPVDWSYVSSLVVNGTVFAPQFQDTHDDDALQVLEAAYPEREIIPVPAREIWSQGFSLRHVALTQPSRGD